MDRTSRISTFYTPLTTPSTPPSREEKCHPPTSFWFPFLVRWIFMTVPTMPPAYLEENPFPPSFRKRHLPSFLPKRDHPYSTSSHVSPLEGEPCPSCHTPYHDNNPLPAVKRHLPSFLPRRERLPHFF